MKLPKSTAKAQQAIERHFCLKFGSVDLAQQRLELRNHYFERIGHCLLSDTVALQALLGEKALDAAFLAQIYAMPMGIITPIDL